MLSAIGRFFSKYTKEINVCRLRDARTSHGGGPGRACERTDAEKTWLEKHFVLFGSEPRWLTLASVEERHELYGGFVLSNFRGFIWRFSPPYYFAS